MMYNQGMYSIDSGYKWLLQEEQRAVWAPMVWNRISPPKYSILGWLGCLERLKTRDRLVKHSVCADTLCVLCQDTCESHSQIFFECVFSRKCLGLAAQWLDMPLPIRDIISWWRRVRCHSLLQNKIIAATIVSIMAQVWYARNRCWVEGYMSRLEVIIQ